jgi:monovalent cation:H+ antiporter-2, CPA2 family
VARGHRLPARPAQPARAAATAGYPDCIRTGQSWVHLRICLECGCVGCCDSSPGRHARAHFEAAGHALLASGEPGETWGHCLLDGTTVEPRTTRPRPLAGS